MRIAYGSTLYGNKLKKAADIFLSQLPKDVGGLISQGSSGCAIASAMIARSRRNLSHLYVRKDGESEHSNGHAGDKNFKTKYAIVDDFISTGKTVNGLWRWANINGLDVAIIIVSWCKPTSELEPTCAIRQIEYLEDEED